MLPDYLDAPVFDEATALALFEDDRELLEEVVALFRTTARRLHQELAASLEAGDLETLVRTAHSLKGASANLAAERIRAVSEALEELGRDARKSGEGVEFDEFLTAIDQEIDMFESMFDNA